MKWYFLLNAFLLTVCTPSLGYAGVAFSSVDLSPEAQDFADKRIAAYCILVRNPDNIDDKCKVTDKSRRIEAELKSKKGPKFLGHIDLRRFHLRGQLDKRDEYVVWAKQLLPASEWLKLTKYPDPHVRTSAFQALVAAYPDTNIIPIILDHLTDSELIERSEHDEVSDQRVGDVFIQIATASSMFTLEVDKFNRKQQQTLFTALLTVPNELNSTTDFLLYAEPFPELYETIRSLAGEDTDTATLVALAKFNKPQDISLIKENLLSIDDIRVMASLPYRERKNAFRHAKRVLQAISFFPDDKFFAELKQHFIRNLTAEYFQDPALPIYIKHNPIQALYAAIASYQNHAALELLTLPYQPSMGLNDPETDTHTELVLSAVSGNINDVYQDLMWTIWAERNTVTNSIFNYLLAKDSERAFELVKSSLSDVEKFRQDCTSLSLAQFNKLLESMLEFSLAKDEIFFVETVKSNIEKTNYGHFHVFINQVITTQNTAFQTSLLRLLNHQSPTIVRKTINALLVYEDEVINQKVVDTLLENKANRDNYGWRKLYEELESNESLAGLIRESTK